MHEKGLPAPVQLDAMPEIELTRPTKKQKGKTTKIMNPNHPFSQRGTAFQSPALMQATM